MLETSLPYPANRWARTCRRGVKMASGKNVAIIGAGVCGISSAICLQESDPTLELTVISDKFSPDVTSDGAAGFWEPVFLKDTPMEKIEYK